MSIIHFIEDSSRLIEILTDRLSPLYEEAELVIIFGSVAENNMKIHSDIDILIVSDTLSRADIFNRLDYITENYGIGYDLILHTYENFQKYKKTSVIVKAVDEGEILWETERIQLN